MAAVEGRKLSSDFQEHSEQGTPVQAVDLSFIHWGYLNSTLVIDQSKKTKDLTWKTYWVDLCGSTLRLYRDLSLSPVSGNIPPPSKVVGPTGEDEKKEAFLVLKKGASISIPNYDEFRPRRKSKNKTDPKRNNVFKLQVINSNNSPVYFFEAPSKGSMYRWISKIEEGIDIADNPQNQSVSDKKLKEAKLLSLESRRYQNVAPELKYSDTKDDTDSGMEGDVEESVEFQEKPPPDPRLEKLLHQLHCKEELLEMLEKGEKAFLGGNGQVCKVSEFQATTKADYYLVPGYTSTLIPKGTQINVLGQLPNRRWRCYVDLPSTSDDACTPDANTAGLDSSSAVCSERLLGSVPTSLLYELDDKETPQTKKTELSVLPMGTPDVTPDVSPHPSPPQSPYSPHKPVLSEERESFLRRSPTNLQRFVPSMDLSDVDAWEQFIIPSPPSTPVTSRSTTPSLSPSESLETLDAVDDDEGDRASSGMSNDIPVTYIGSLPDSEPVDTSSPPPVVLRNKDMEAIKQPDQSKNYSFLVTKKLRQRGISLIVGSSSSEDEDDFDEGSEGAYKAKISRRKLDQELERCAAENDDPAVVRPYSAFLPRKTKTLDFGSRPKNVTLRTATTDDLLKDYSSNNVSRSKTCVTLKGVLGGTSSPENAPPINQRRTIQLKRSDKEGFGFTLQTYGIVQQNGEVDYMTFVLAVEDDGPAYMAGMRPGDIIVSIENNAVEEADHKTLVSMLQSSSSSVRMVVVFVDAIRRMHLNTQIKVLLTELHNKEDEFKHLCEKEEGIVKRTSDPGVLAGLELDVLCPTRSGSDSYLYTTELTSSFSKDTPKVKDSLVKYRQHLDDKPRRTSLPDQHELTKQRLVSTTGSELLRSFASSAESILKKTASIKLKKKVQKAKQISKTFKSYLEEDEESSEGPIETSSPKHKPSKKTSEPARLSWPRKDTTDLSQGDSLNAKSGKISQLPSCKSMPATIESPKSMNLKTEQSTQMSKPDTISTPLDMKIFPDQEDSTDKTESGGLSCEKTTPVDLSRDMLSFGFPSRDNTPPSNLLGDKTYPGKLTCEKTPSFLTRDEKSPGSLSRDMISPNDDTSPQSSPVKCKDRTICPSVNEDTASNEPAASLTTTESTDAEQKIMEILKQTKNKDTKVKTYGNNVPKEKSDERERDNKSSQNVIKSGSKSLPPGTATTNVDRGRTNNIASLRKLFEAQNTSTNNAKEESDVFPSDRRKGTPKRPEIARTRLGSRPVSYMRAMDAAEDSPIIPDDIMGGQEKDDDSPFETSA